VYRIYLYEYIFILVYFYNNDFVAIDGNCDKLMVKVYNSKDFQILTRLLKMRGSRLRE
jgi:hypothetical protein